MAETATDARIKKNGEGGTSIHFEMGKKFCITMAKPLLALSRMKSVAITKKFVAVFVADRIAIAFSSSPFFLASKAIVVAMAELTPGKIATTPPARAPLAMSMVASLFSPSSIFWEGNSSFLAVMIVEAPNKPARAGNMEFGKREITIPNNPASMKIKRAFFMECDVVITKADIAIKMNGIAF